MAVDRKKHRLGLCMKGLVWNLWFLFLFAAPFSMERAGSVLLLDYSYAYISAGFLLGAFLFRVISKTSTKRGQSAVALILGILGILFFLSLIAPVWLIPGSEVYASPLGLEWHESANSTLSVWDYYLLWAFADLSISSKIALFIEGLSCGFLGASYSRIRTLKPIGNLEADAKENEAIPNCRRSVPVLFLLGAIVGLTWIASLVAPLAWREQVAATGFDPAFVSALSSAMVVLFVLLVCIVIQRTGISFVSSAASAPNVPLALLMSFAFGRILCCVISSCVFERELLLELLLLVLATLLATLVLFAVTLVLTCLCPFKKAAGIEVAAAEPPALHNKAETIFISANLTEREQAVVLNLLKGKTSMQSGEALGLKAATVRTYLQRAYKKLDVENSKQLLELLSEHEAAYQAETANSSVKAGRLFNLDSSTVTAPFSVVLITLLALLYLPFHSLSMHGAWYLEHGTVVGKGLGLLLSLFVRYSTALTNKPIVSAHKIKCVLFAVIFTLASFAMVLLRCWWPVVFEVLGVGLSSLLVLFITAIHICMCSRLLMLLSRNSAMSLVKNDYLVPSSAIVLLLVMPSSFSALFWRSAVIVVAAIVSVGVLVYLVSHSNQSENSSFLSAQATPIFNGQAFTMLFAAIGFGFVLGEQWHGEESSFSFITLVMFSGTLLFVCLAALYKAKKLRLSSALALGLTMLYAALTVHVVLALFVPLLTFALLLAIHTARKEECVSKWEIGIAGASLGLIGGHGITDSWASVASLGLDGLSSGSSAQFMMLVAPTILVLLLFACLVSSIFVLGDALSSRKPEFSKEIENRKLLYLRSQGLSKIQANVLLLVSQGATGTQVAQELFYSIGAVNTMRAEGYRKLGLHSAQQLSELLEQSVPAGHERQTPKHKD